jgi:SAM-dependent methyltransferase
MQRSQPRIDNVRSVAVGARPATPLPPSETPGREPGVQWTWITCNACGADAFVELHRCGEWHIGRCAACALIYVNPLPLFTAASYARISHDFYYTKLQRQITRARVAFERRQLAQQQRRIAAVSPSSAADGLSFLDVGCGPGLAVRAAADLGWDPLGIDIDADLVALGRRQLGVDLRCAGLLDARFPDDRFDFVRFKSVLHLLSNPYEVLVEVRRVLQPGGVVLIVVPNERGLLNQLGLLAGRRRSNRRGTLVLPYHAHAFTPATLTRMLQRAGLTPAGVETATPVDPTYAAISYLERRSLRLRALALVWRLARALGGGSLLVAYAHK